MEIKYINPAALHDEMLRLRQEEQMDFLECLTGMDWGEPDTAKDTPDTPRGLGFYHRKYQMYPDEPLHPLQKL